MGEKSHGEVRKSYGPISLEDAEVTLHEVLRRSYNVVMRLSGRLSFGLRVRAVIG